jgi:cytochrome c551/c552
MPSRQHKLVGPSFAEIAGKYKADDATKAMLAKKVKEGGVGTWGQIPMPPNAGVPDSELAA